MVLLAGYALLFSSNETLIFLLNHLTLSDDLVNRVAFLKLVMCKMIDCNFPSISHVISVNL